MTTDLKILHNPCEGRRRFLSFTAAAEAMKRATVVGAPLAVEKCDKCHGWHFVELKQPEMLRR